MTIPTSLLAGLVALLVTGCAAWAWRRRSKAAAGTGTAVRVAPAEATAVEDPGGTIPEDWTEARTADLLRRLLDVAFDTGGAEGTDAVEPQDVPATRARHAGVVATAVAILARIEDQPRYTPRRPQLLPQLMQAVNDSDASLRSIAAIIAQDPALAGNLLRIANSSMYRVQARPMESLERAVAMVGTEGVRLIITAALVQPVMDVEEGISGRLSGLIWDHTLLASAAGAEHARLTGHGDTFAAQLLGLLQGLGAIIVVRVLRDAYAKQPELAPDRAVVTALLDGWAAPTARRLANSWGLAARLGRALPGCPSEATQAPPTGLARSLRFGRVAAALALLHRRERIGADEALATLSSIEPHADTAARLWARVLAASEANGSVATR